MDYFWDVTKSTTRLIRGAIIVGNGVILNNMINNCVAEEYDKDYLSDEFYMTK